MKKLLLLLCFLSIGSFLMAVDLVKDGKAAGEFIIPEEPHRALLWSVTDIRHWIHEMSGVNIPILHQPSEKKNIKIFIGEIFAGEWKKDLNSLKGTDGYAIRSKGDNIYVFGTRPRGTLYGVFGLLERNTDIIWARPNRRFGTIFGQTKDIKLTNINVLDKPVFPVRSQGGHFRPFHQDTEDWRVRNLANQSGANKKLDMVIKVHDIPYWRLSRTLKKKEYLKKNPEIFAYVDKFKKRDPHGICYMNPKLVDIYFKELMALIDAKEKQYGRKVDYVSLHMGDSWLCCECPLCMKPIKLKDGSYLKAKDPSSYKDLVFRSTQYYMFYSKIMERLKKVRPDLHLYVLAYIYSAAVPEIPPHPDLQIGFCPYPTSNMHFAMLDKRQPAAWRERYEGWLKITKRLSMREYYNANTIAPISLTCQQDLMTLMKNEDVPNIVIMTETRDDVTGGDPGWDLSTMEMWLINRMFWDPTQDMNELRKRFIERTYREAEPAMTKFYDLIRDSWTEPDDKTICGWHVSSAHIYENVIVKKGLEKKCLGYLREALQTVINPNSRIMIQRIYDNLRSMNQGMGKLIVADIPEMSQDGNTFESVQWEKPLPLKDFRLPYLYKKPSMPSCGTQVRAGHDGKTMYVRFDVIDPDIAKMDSEPSIKDEKFIKKDHIEFYLYSGKDIYLLSFNSNGCKYDSKNLNKLWNLDWKLNVEKTKNGWSAIISLPLKDFKLSPGKKTTLKWSALRESKHKGAKPEISIYKGMSLHYRKYPIIME